MTASRRLAFRFLGRRRYEPVWKLQNELAQSLQAVAGASEGAASSEKTGPHETLLAVEHEPVITLGRRGQPDDVLIDDARRQELGVDLFRVERGGEVTYHGPGQLVLYPIVRVLPAQFGVGDLVRNLAGAINDCLAELGIDAVYDKERPGLWVGADESGAGGAKIAAVGMRVARGVSTHGAALNVETDLDAFSWIVPCGLPTAPVTSIANELGETAETPTLEALARDIAGRFAERLGFELVMDGAA